MKLYPTCPFCNARPATSAEHIVLKSLGGTKTVRGLLCETCNVRFGHSIDAELETAFRPLSLICGSKTGERKNKEWKRVADIDVMDTLTGTQSRMTFGGLKHVAKPYSISLRFGAEVENFRLARYDPLVFAKVIAASLRRRGLDASALADMAMQPVETPISDGVIRPKLSLGGPAQFRSVAKMGMAAARRERALTGSTEARPLVEFIQGSNLDWEFSFEPSSWNWYRQVCDAKPGQHCLLVVRRAGCWEAAFVAFGFFPYRVRFPDLGDNFRGIVHVVDPQIPEHNVRNPKHATMSNDPDWKSTFDREVNTWIQEVGHRVQHEAMQDIAIESSVGEVFSELRADGHEFVEQEHVGLLAARATQAFFNPRMSMGVSPDMREVKQLVEKIMRNEIDPER
ncbi:MAG: hypothetical protein H6733_10135 [Alphaproteobacteria bacterium]|nr:hypothetical protein [Alphaproteobacteria bacterium]